MNTGLHVALVTGADKGIGFETVRRLAQLGFAVWLGSRDQERGDVAATELAADGDVRVVQLDVTDAESVTAAAGRVARESGALDVLVNNAGIANPDGEGVPSTVRLETIQQDFDVNFYGALRVTQAFLPLVRKARAGRIVNVSSTMGSIGELDSPGSLVTRHPAFAYPSSKTALNSLTGWLAVELHDTPIKVNSVCPGFNATDLTYVSGTQPRSEGAKGVLWAATLPADGPTGGFFNVRGPMPW